MLDFKNVHSRDEIHRAVFSTLAANGMRDNTHIRLTMSRGEKTTSSMNPNFNVFGCTLIVLAEHKPVVSVATYDNSKGVGLVTASQRRNPPSCLDSKIHHNNLLNNIIPKIQVGLCGFGGGGDEGGGGDGGGGGVELKIQNNSRPSTIDHRPSTIDRRPSTIDHRPSTHPRPQLSQANNAGCADALMLDIEGFVSETNATNVFCVVGGAVLTPTADACLPGVTRALVIQLCGEERRPESLSPIATRHALSRIRHATSSHDPPLPTTPHHSPPRSTTLTEENGIPCEVRRISLTEFVAADEVFTTGTLRCCVVWSLPIPNPVPSTAHPLRPHLSLPPGTMGELTPVVLIDGRPIGNGVPGPMCARLSQLFKTLIDREGYYTPIPEF